jgi:hypothetical protein
VDEVNLDRLLDLTMHGDYVVRVGRYVSGAEGRSAIVWTPWFDLKLSGSFHEAVEAQKVILEPTYEGVRCLGTQARQIIGALQQLAADDDDTAQWEAGHELEQIRGLLAPPADAPRAPD